MDHWQPESMPERRGSSSVGRSAGFYKHSAPLEPEGMEGLRFYKHLAPLEPGGDEMLAVGHYCGYYC